MTARIRDANAQRAYRALQNSGGRGRQLAEELDARRTRVWVTPFIQGGFTLNFINSIMMMPLPANASDWTFKAWVSVLGHEACHVEQRFWVDSVQQEIVAYNTQVRVGDELGIDLADLRRSFADLNPKSQTDLVRAQTALLTLFTNSPAMIVYASLPLIQPVRLHAIMPGARELAAVIRAAFVRPPT